MANELSDLGILIVDNPTEIRNVREMLRDVGFNKVSDNSSALTVLTEIKKNPPQVVIANLHLPRYSGMQLFKSIVNDRQLASIKFIMTTPKLNRRELEEVEKDGVKQILQRPFSADDLREAIFNLFGMGTDDLKAAAADTAKEGHTLFSDGKFEDSLKRFKQASDAFPTPEYYFMQGRCYMELGLIDQAIAAFGNTKSSDPRYPELDHWLAETKKAKAEAATAVKYLEKAAGRENAPAAAHVELGKGYLNVDEVEKAEQSFGKAIELDPDNVVHRTTIGNAYLDKGVYDKAEQAFGDAIDINPENIPLYNRMAIALRKQGKVNEAINLYIKALKIAPKDEGLYFNLARALNESGDTGKALKSLDKAISLDPEFAEAIELRAEYAKATQG